MGKSSGLFCACLLACLAMPADMVTAGGFAAGAGHHAAPPFAKLDAAFGWKTLDQMAGLLTEEADPRGFSRKESIAVTPAMLPDPVEPPSWIANAVAYKPVSGRPMIAIVIDDMGLDVRRSARAAALPAPVTLAFLPYARNLAGQTARARSAGHELLVHMPMEPEGGADDPGPNALLTGLSPEEVAQRLERNLAAFDGFVGINNHMGSKFTQDDRRLAVVMEELQRRSLMFLDSRTAPASLAESVAEKNGVPTTHRDVFLDNEATLPAVMAALANLEEQARRRGMAVAIGHPHDATIAALEAWLPQAAEKGFQIVPITTIVRYQDKRFDIAGMSDNMALR